MDENLIKELIIENIEEGILIFDISLNIVYANKRCKEKLSIINEEIVGKSLYYLFKSVTPADSHIVKVIETGKPIIGYYDEFITCFGKKVNLFNSTYPIFENGEIIGVIDLYREMNGFYEMENRIDILENEKENRLIKNKNRVLNGDNGTIFSIDNFIGSSKSIVNFRNKIHFITSENASILVYGETGTGKEIVAQSLHNISNNRKMYPFIAQNCAAIPNSLLESILFGTEKGVYTDAENRAGLFELANGGTLFLDEINSMNINLQGKLLRVLEDGLIRRIGSENIIRVNTRVITSTNESPQSLLENKKLRTDLFYRLNTIYLEIPPLRERPEDIEELVDYYIKYYNKKYNKNVEKVSAELMEMFVQYNWPGNVRELQNMLENTIGVIGEIKEINTECISETFCSKLKSYYKNGSIISQDIFSKSLSKNLSEYERNLIEEDLIKCKGNISATAKLLNIPKQTLYSKIKKYNIDWNIEIN